jgi:hypothetical protein
VTFAVAGGTWTLVRGRWHARLTILDGDFHSLEIRDQSDPDNELVLRSGPSVVGLQVLLDEALNLYHEKKGTMEVTHDRRDERE